MRRRFFSYPCADGMLRGPRVLELALILGLVMPLAGGAPTSGALAAPPPPGTPPGDADAEVPANQPLLRDPRVVGSSDTGRGEVVCEVTAQKPCSGRMDFDKASTYTFKIPGPGKVTFHNASNHRCALEYSLLDSTIATAGRSMSLAAGGENTLDVRDAQGMTVRFATRGLGSEVCDLDVAVHS